MDAFLTAVDSGPPVEATRGWSTYGPAPRTKDLDANDVVGAEATEVDYGLYQHDRADVNEDEFLRTAWQRPGSAPVAGRQKKMVVDRTSYGVNCLAPIVGDISSPQELNRFYSVRANKRGDACDYSLMPGMVGPRELPLPSGAVGSDNSTYEVQQELKGSSCCTRPSCPQYQPSFITGTSRPSTAESTRRPGTAPRMRATSGGKEDIFAGVLQFPSRPPSRPTTARSQRSRPSSASQPERLKRPSTAGASTRPSTAGAATRSSTARPSTAGTTTRPSSGSSRHQPEMRSAAVKASGRLPQEAREMMVDRLLDALDSTGSITGSKHSKSPRARAAYASMQRNAMKGAMYAQGTTKSRDASHALVPSSSKSAIHDRLRRMFPEYAFHERDVVIKISKPREELAAAAKQAQKIEPQMVFPRFEVLILGKMAPLSGCCAQPLFIDFDVVDGAILSCSARGCAGPILFMTEDPPGFRAHVWGPWVGYYGGVLPAIRSPSSETSSGQRPDQVVDSLAGKPDQTHVEEETMKSKPQVLCTQAHLEFSPTHPISPTSEKSFQTVTTPAASPKIDKFTRWVSKGWNLLGDVHFNPPDSPAMQVQEHVFIEDEAGAMQPAKPRVVNIELASNLSS